MVESVYRQKVDLLLRLMPLVMGEGVFAVHGGSAINLFVLDVPRYSVDIDLTYIPLKPREESLLDITAHLQSIATKGARHLRGLHVVHNRATCKLLCEYHGYQVKIEVNFTKRGIIGGEVLTLPLCEKAQEEFGVYCEATIVPLTLLYGGKIAAALSRQHPRDLFDVKHMQIPMRDVREGLLFCLLGSDRPIHESIAPTLLDQREAKSNQFDGMTDMVFTYEDYEAMREKLVADVREMLTEDDKRFLVGFERCEPKWEGYEFAYFRDYPSVQWKLLNLAKLRNTNPAKLMEEAEKLEKVLGIK